MTENIHFPCEKITYIELLDIFKRLSYTLDHNLKSKDFIVNFIVKCYNDKTPLILNSLARAKSKKYQELISFKINGLITINTYAENCSLLSMLSQIDHFNLNTGTIYTIDKINALMETVSLKGFKIDTHVEIITHDTLIKPGQDWISHFGKAVCTSRIEDSQDLKMQQTFNILVPSYLSLSKDPEEHKSKIISIIKLALKSQYNSLNVEGSIQVDAHPTNADLDQAIWIGMTLSILSGGEAFVLPVFLVGGDIGCGMTAIPLVTEAGQLFNADMLSQVQLEKFMIIFMKNCQKLLRRGNAVEKGEFSKYETYNREEFMKVLNEVSVFATGTTLTTILDDLFTVLLDLELIKCKHLELKDQITLDYILPFMGSLGSSGNHFFEILKDGFNNLIACIHSGSRGLGAKVYEAMKLKLPLLQGDKCIAVSLNDVDLVSKTYDALNKFALFNRAFCYHLIVKSMSSYNLTVNAEKILSAYENLPYIKLMTAENAGFKNVRLLAQGIIHNGVSGLSIEVEGATYYTIVVKKGSVILTPDSIAIVANDCCSDTPGCTIVTNSFKADVQEVSLAEIFAQVRDGKGTLIPVHDDKFKGVVSLPHGAGRDQSAHQTMKRTKLGDFSKIVKKLMAWSISPDTAGDCPGGKAYKSQNLQAYKSDTIAMFGLETLLNFKEGINLGGVKLFLQFLEEFYQENVKGLDLLNSRIQKGAKFSELDIEERQLFKYLMAWDLILVYSAGKDLRVHLNPIYSSMVLYQTTFYRALETGEPICDTFAKYARTKAIEPPL